MPFKNQPPLYSVWQSMRRRCLTPTTRQFEDYGGRGITICPEWDDYETFARDMGERPPGHSLERIDTNGNYEPSNCKWATRKEQQRNQRCTRFVTIGASSYRAADLAEMSGLKTDTIVYRASRGLDLGQVLSRERFISEATTAAARKAISARVRNQKAKTHCKRGHEFTPANTVMTPAGCRSCKTCERNKPSRKRKTVYVLPSS